MPRQRKKTIPKILKDLTWQRWIGDDIAKAKCLCCGINEIKMNSFHCGHVISEADGGPTTVDNLRPVCATCNLSMRTQNMEKFKGQHGLGQGAKGMASPNSLIIADGNIRASTRIGSTDLSISVPISTVVQTVKTLFTS
jgi:hypothetical protein